MIAALSHCFCSQAICASMDIAGRQRGFISSIFSNYQGQDKLCIGIDRYELDLNGRPRKIYGHWTKVGHSVAHSNIGNVNCR